MFAIVKLILITGQAIYWYWLRDDEWDGIVWDACLYPGKGEWR